MRNKINNTKIYTVDIIISGSVACLLLILGYFIIMMLIVKISSYCSGYKGRKKYHRSLSVYKSSDHLEYFIGEEYDEVIVNQDSIISEEGVEDDEEEAEEREEGQDEHGKYQDNSELKNLPNHHQSQEEVFNLW